MMVDCKVAVTHCIQKWQLEEIQPIAYESFISNYVAIVYSQSYKQKCVLKISVKDDAHRERKALQYFNDTTDTCVRLLDYDDKYDALLLSYISAPVLATYFPERDDEALVIAANLIKQLYAKPCVFKRCKNFKLLTFNLIERFSHELPAGLSQSLLLKAKAMGEMLVTTQKALYVLHGDLHHNNILYDGVQAIAIDPKGIVAELEFEVIRFIMNPKPELLEQENALAIITHRIERFSEIFGFDMQRLWQWFFVCSVQGACWAQEDGNVESVEYFGKLAHLVSGFVKIRANGVKLQQRGIVEELVWIRE